MKAVLLRHVIAAAMIEVETHKKLGRSHAAAQTALDEIAAMHSAAMALPSADAAALCERAHAAEVEIGAWYPAYAEAQRKLRENPERVAEIRKLVEEGAKLDDIAARKEHAESIGDLLMRGFSQLAGDVIDNVRKRRQSRAYNKAAVYNPHGQGRTPPAGRKPKPHGPRPR